MTAKTREKERESLKPALMAEESREERKGSSKEEEDSVKLFVGQVPKHMTEDQLLAMFQEFALVDEVNIIKDKTTRASRGFFLLLFISTSVSFVFTSLSLHFHSHSLC